MSMSLIRRAAPLGLGLGAGLLCSGAPPGGVSGVCSEPAALRCEDELDGYTEDELDTWCCGAPREEEKETPAREHLQRDTEQLLHRYYRSCAGLRNRGPSHRAEPTLNRVVQDLRSKHGMAFTGMVKRLLKEPDVMATLGNVMENVFSDGVVNWGRIGTVLTLGALLCEQLKCECVDGRVDASVDAVVLQISSYLSTHQSSWFITHDGWDGFVDFFHVYDPEAAVRNTLMAVAGFAGLGAWLIKLTR